jgi:glycosyltransferase involved in cell wall biosynthesis
MSSAHKLTVCVPCFNEERFIGKAIESLLTQTYKDFTVQVVDDCSSDGTLGIVSAFRDPRIEVHRNSKNLGLYENLNRCLRSARTPYVKIFCADDVLAPNCLEEELAVLERYPKLALSFCASTVIDADGRLLLRRRLYSQSRRIDGKKLIRVILASARNPIGEPTGVMFRRRVVRHHSLRFRAQDFSHMADLDFWIQLFEYGDGYYIDKRLFSFRLHKSAGTVGLLKRSVAEHRKLLREYGERYSISQFQRVLFYLKLLLYFVGKMGFVRLFAR